jgi:hypothetical protein
LLQNPRIQDDVGMKLKSTQSYPDQTTFQDISCCRIVSSRIISSSTHQESTARQRLPLLIAWLLWSCQPLEALL